MRTPRAGVREETNPFFERRKNLAIFSVNEAPTEPHFFFGEFSSARAIFFCEKFACQEKLGYIQTFPVAQIRPESLRRFLQKRKGPIQNANQSNPGS
jgi:hypothetical protein